MSKLGILSLLGWLAALGAAAVAFVLLGELRDTRADLRLETVRLPAPEVTRLPADWTTDSHRVLLVGDSRIRQWGTLPVIDGVAFGTSAIGGETTGELLDRFQRDVLDLDQRPDEIILAAGINDLVATTVQTRRADRLDGRISDLMIDNLQTMADLARAQRIKVRIATIVQPTTPSLTRRLLFWDDRLYRLVSAANARLRDMDHEIIDFNGVLEGGDGPMPERFSIDTLHFNSLAYDALNDALIAAYGSAL